MTEPEHTDIGAYVLGLLEPDEAERFEEHLFGCDQCSAELEEFSDLPALLQPLVAEDDDAEPLAVAQPSAELLPKVLDEVSGARTRRRRRNLLALAAAVALIVAGPVVGVAIGRHSASTSTPTDSVAAELVMMGERHTATNAANGVSAVIGLEQRDWGTHIAVELRGVKGPLTCDLVAVGKDGSTQVVTNWYVPPHGYGVPGHTAPLDLHGGSSMAKSDIDHVEVRTDTQQVLVSVPV